MPPPPQTQISRSRQLERGALPGGRPAEGLIWFDTAGCELSDEAMNAPELAAFSVLMRAVSPSSGSSETHERHLLLLVSSEAQTRNFTLPVLGTGQWRQLLNTAAPSERKPVSDQLELAPRSLALLRLA